MGVEQQLSISTLTSRSMYDFPGELKLLLLAEQASWTTSELLGNLNHLKDVTIRELISLESETCKKRQQLLQLSRFFIPINERPYLIQYLGHQLFASTQKRGVLYYKLALSVKVLVFNHSGPIDGSIEVEYYLDDKAYSKGCLLCGSGIILDSCPEKTADAINCYLDRKSVV